MDRYIFGQFSQPRICLQPKSPKFWVQSSLGSPENRRLRSRGPPDLRPIPDGVCEPICIRKKCAIWTRWRPGATLDDLREAVTTLEETERTARRVLGGAHPTTAGIGEVLQEARAALSAREG